MPLTWFAHQVPVFGMKLARPTWFDGTALVFASMAPDIAYAFSSYLQVDTHRVPAAFTVGVPTALVMATVFRIVVAPVIATCFGDFGPFRVRSYGVLAHRRPAWTITVSSAVLGVGSHVVFDWFTHPGRPGVRWLGYDDVAVTVGSHREPLAGVFQVIGHSIGSLVGAWLLVVIARRGLLERWYGTAAVDEVRAASPSARRWIVWLSIAVGLVIGAVWAIEGSFIERIQRVGLGAFVGLVMGAAVVGRLDERPDLGAQRREMLGATR